MRLEGLKIAVTGGMGYIGSHTCKVLQAAGADVYAIDNRMVEQNRLDGVGYFIRDYADITMLSELRSMGIDGFVHCAGTSLTEPSIMNPAEYYKNNVVNTIAMLDHLKTWSHVPFVVFSSSAAVYGDLVTGPIDEDDDLAPITPYATTKIMIEMILADYDTAHDIRSISFRYFNAVGADVWDNDLGPEDNDTHILPELFKAYTQQGVFRLYGTDYNTPDGTCIRDYIHVCDIALAHLDACVRLSEGAESAVFNLGTGKGYSNQELIELFKGIVGDFDVLAKEKRKGDPDSLVANAELYYNNHKPQFSDMTTIIRSLKDYYEKHR